MSCDGVRLRRDDSTVTLITVVKLTIRYTRSLYTRTTARTVMCTRIFNRDEYRENPNRSQSSDSDYIDSADKTNDEFSSNRPVQ